MTKGDVLVTEFWRGNNLASHINFFDPAACAYWKKKMDAILDNLILMVGKLTRAITILLRVLKIFILMAYSSRQRLFK